MTICLIILTFLTVFRYPTTVARSWTAVADSFCDVILTLGLATLSLLSYWH